MLDKDGNIIGVRKSGPIRETFKMPDLEELDLRWQYAKLKAMNQIPSIRFITPSEGKITFFINEHPTSSLINKKRQKYAKR